MIRRILRKIRTVMGKSPPKRDVSPSPAPPQPESVSGEELANIECDAQELLERLQAGESVVIVDVRERFELEQHGQIENAIHIPLRELPTRWEELKEANEIVCYCAAGSRSYNAAMLLREKGLFNATSLDGGIKDWVGVGAPTVKPS
ncbi:MAG: rhodanese-like domain-containing protein [Myxococcota bacterium]|nr:rhodanese-like domain-containing protein [Myxococcota bacterium]